MSWDDEEQDFSGQKGRQAENKELRRLTVAIMKLREVALIDALEIDLDLRESLIHGWNIDDFRGKRRHERTILNELRLADKEDIEILLELVSDPKQAEINLKETVEEWYQELVKGGNNILNQCLEEFEIEDIQYFRQLIRNAKKAKGTKKTAPRTKLLNFLDELVFGVD
tara:strand:- start:105 stop:611 length:507 start_codon:yes stop_codon:yes gene_type:complete